MTQYKKKYAFGKINRDMAPDKRSDDTQFDVVNMETYLTDRGLSLKAMPGTGDRNSISAELDGPFPYYVIGDAYIDSRLFFFATQNTSFVSGADPDRIWELLDDGTTVTIDLKYESNMNLRTTQPIDAIGYKDSQDVSKLYWVDGVNQARFQDVDNPTSNIDFLLAVGVGGTITAERTATPAFEDAVARYGFQTYNVGGQASKLSALSDPINLSIENGSALITITGMSPSYTNVRVYRLIYRAFNAPPAFELIWDTEYGAPGTISFEDTGSLFISSASIEDILSLGGDLVRPHTLTPKFQHLFFGNLEIEPFEVDPEFDTRAYAYGLNVTDFWIEEVGGLPQNFFNWVDVPTTHDAVNANDNAWKYTFNSADEGVEGENIKVKVRWLYSGDFIGARLYKQGETYRVGVHYKDTYGRWSSARWVADILIPYVDYRGAYCGLEGTIKNLPPGAVQAKFLVMPRSSKDKTVLFQGVPQNAMSWIDNPWPTGALLGISPYPFMRGLCVDGNIDLGIAADPFDIQTRYINDLDFRDNTNTDLGIVDKSIALVVSPDSYMERQDPAATGAVLVGTIRMTVGSSFLKYTNTDPDGIGGVDQTYFNPSAPISTDKPVTIPRPNITGWGVPNCILSDFNDNDPNEPNNAKRMSYMYHRQSTGNVREMANDKFTIDEIKFVDFDNTGVVAGTAIQNSVDYANFAGDGSGQGAGVNPQYTNLETEGISKYLVKFDDMDWSGGSDIGYDRFEKPTVPGEVYFPIIDIVRDNPTQYGGKTFEVKSSNIYIDASEALGVGSINMFGDTYVGIYALPYNTGARKNLTNKYTTVYDFVYVQLESQVDPLEFNVDMDDAFSTTEVVCEQKLALESKNWMKYDEVFSQQDLVSITAGLPFNFVNVTDYQYRIVPTLVKSPGAVIDPWTEVLTGTFIDLEGVYGPIIKLVKVNDTVIAFQTKAISVVKVFPTAQTTTSSGQVQLGKGKILDEYEILKVESGISNLESIKVVDGMMFYIDARNKTLNSFKDGEISTLLGFNTITRNLISPTGPLLNESPIDGQFVAVDRNNDNIFFRFHESVGVLVYNYASKQFTHRRTYREAERFISFDNFVYMSSKSAIWKHNSGVINNYFGLNLPNTSLEMWVEPLPGFDKVYDAITILKRGSIFDEITITSNTRISGTQAPDFKSKFDIFTTHLPRVIGTMDRWRERNIKILLNYTGDEPFELDAITLKFTIKKS